MKVRWPLDRKKIASLVRLFRLFAPHLKPHRKRMIAAWLCMLGATLAYLAQPWPIKLIFDYVLMPGDSSQAGYFASTPTATLVGGAAAAVLLIALVRGVFGYGQAYLAASVGQRVIASVRKRLFRHIQRLSHSFHDEQHSGDLLLRLTGDIQLLRDLLVNAVLLITERILVMIAVAAVMLWMDWQLAVVALAVLPALMLVSFKVSGKIRVATRKQRKRESQTANILAETLSALPVIQAHAREAWEDERFSKQHKASLKAGLKTTRLEANLNRVVEVILAAGTAAVLWFGVHRVLSGALTPGDLLVFTAYLTTLYKPIRKLATLTSRLSKSAVCGERLISILETQPQIADLPDARPADPFQGEIVFHEVTFAYERNKKPVLENVSFHIPPGKTVALVGASGAGKSTIAKLVLRFYEPQSGRIEIDRRDIRSYTLSSLRGQISIVMQDPHLFALTVRENIAYGRLDATQEDIERAARLACAHDFIMRLPNGYDTVLAENGASLSAGQRQRIAIARAIVRDAPIVILDEPMTGLDVDSEEKVMLALQRLTAGRTCLLITHDLESAEHTDMILRVGLDGKVSLVSPDTLTASRASQPQPQPQPQSEF